MGRTAAEIQADLATVSARIAEILNQQNGGNYGRLYASGGGGGHSGGEIVVDQFKELELLQKMRTDLLGELASISAETFSDIDDPSDF